MLMENQRAMLIPSARRDSSRPMFGLLRRLTASLVGLFRNADRCRHDPAGKLRASECLECQREEAW